MFYPRKGALHHKNYPGRVDFKMTILAGLKKLKKFKGVERVLLSLPWREENFLPVLPTGIGLIGSMTAICAPCL